MTAQLLVMPAAQYHQDPCEQPSLSSSLAQIIVNESPMHAWAAHPRLNASVSRDSARRAEIGSVAHKLALGAGSDVIVLPYADYRKNEAKEARAATEADGKIPILSDDMAAATALAKPLTEAAEDYMGAKIADCLTERVIIWQEESGGWRRAMIDLMSKDFLKVCDLKTTEASVSPNSCARRIYDAYDVQHGFYMRGVDALDPAGVGRRRFGFIFAEQNTPHAVSPPIELSEAGQELGRNKVEYACKIWDSCMKTGEWPSFGSEVFIAEPPSWALMNWNGGANRE